MELNDMAKIRVPVGTLCKFKMHTVWVSGKRVDYETIGWYMGYASLNIIIKLLFADETLNMRQPGMQFYYHYSCVDEITPI